MTDEADETERVGPPEGRGRILFYDPYPHVVAGAQRATILLMQGLSKRGWQVALATPAPGPLVEAATVVGLTVSVAPLPRALSVYGGRTRGWRAVRAGLAVPGAWLGLARWLRGRADVIHILEHRGQLMIGPAARLAGIPVVWHIHGAYRNRAFNAIGSRLARRIVVPSRVVAEQMDGLRSDIVTVVPNGLSPSSLYPPARRPPAEPTAITLTRLHPDKGIDILLRAAVITREHFPSLRYRIVGPTQVGFEDYQRELVDLAHQLGLDDSVEFVGPVSDPQSLLVESSIYVQSSRGRTEVQPLSILEAMALALPVVATDVGAVAEMLGQGVRGTLVRPEDPAALAAAIGSVLAHPDQAEKVAREAQTYVREACSPELMVRRIEAVYRAL
jgi:glycosyltransferase involved in cell wall biosynthesis